MPDWRFDVWKTVGITINRHERLAWGSITAFLRLGPAASGRLQVASKRTTRTPDLTTMKHLAVSVFNQGVRVITARPGAVLLVDRPQQFSQCNRRRMEVLESKMHLLSTRDVHLCQSRRTDEQQFGGCW